MELTERLSQTAAVLQKALEGRNPQRMKVNGARPAAVLMPLLDLDDRVQVVFTRRNNQLPQHAGQISFPGGMADPDDPGPLQTALRETHEEIGVPPEKVRPLAELDQVHTVTNFLVTPFLGLLEPRVEFELNPVEVDRLVIVPLAKVVNPESYQATRIDWRGYEIEDLALTHHGQVIWGATGRMLRNFVASLGQAAPEVALAAGNAF